MVNLTIVQSSSWKKMLKGREGGREGKLVRMLPACDRKMVSSPPPSLPPSLPSLLTSSPAGDKLARCKSYQAPVHKQAGIILPLPSSLPPSLPPLPPYVFSCGWQTGSVQIVSGPGTHTGFGQSVGCTLREGGREGGREGSERVILSKHTAFINPIFPVPPSLPPSLPHSLISPQRARDKRRTIYQNRQNQRKRHPPRQLAAGGVFKSEEDEEAEGAEPVLELEEEGREGESVSTITHQKRPPSLLPPLPPLHSLPAHIPSSPPPSTSPTPASPPGPTAPALPPAEGHSERQTTDSTLVLVLLLV